ncbi:MAG TPA: dienelactone hydrolase family protein, partial [Phycisphaerales bacterium]|nr:dienelactone hydrolase family protein [Phycisphaerales bacterium]
MKTHTINYKDGSDEFEGFVANDEKLGSGGEKPCVVICHAWGGQGEFEREKAKALAGLGYIGFAMDVYGRGKRGKNPEENTKLMTPLVQDRGLLHRRLEAGMNAARSVAGVNTSKMGAIGFCFGGMCALDLARHGSAGLRGVVSFHGLFMAPPANVVKPGK